MSRSFLFERVKHLVRAGFVSKKELFARVSWMKHEGEVKDDPEILPMLRGYAAKLWARVEAEEKTWKGISLNDRLDAAFAALEEQGIFAAQDFTCCSTCGHSEAYGTVRERQEKGQSARGYVFYHQQDTEGGLEGDGLYLAYGATADGEDATLEVGHEICRVLSQYGIPHQWNGSSRSRIYINPFAWRKRRCTEAPPITLEEPWRVLSHPDGRLWAGRVHQGRLELRIRDSEGDIISRTPRARDPNAELSRLLSALLTDGFEEDPGKGPPDLPN